uniref:Peroxisomal biogenesis factor 26 n=1 Tax=Cyanistes caeruleus TaxID=156563 RepID=A0A8C0UU27_CYACU
MSVPQSPLCTADPRRVAAGVRLEASTEGHQLPAPSGSLHPEGKQRAVGYLGCTEAHWKGYKGKCCCKKHLFRCLFLTSFAEVKCSLCVVGIQALAEMNRWREVLSWVLQYYHVPEHLPPKVLELCILLYSKVREPQVMLEVGSSWLRACANQSLPEFGALLELYLEQVLLPLGRFEGAEELVQGCAALDSERQLAFLGTIRESRRRWAQREETRALSQKLLTMLTLLRRAMRSMSNHFYLLPYKKMLLATFLLYLVVVRLDPGT